MKSKLLSIICMAFILVVIFAPAVSAERLPTIDGDSGTWGTVLNEYLSKLAGKNASVLNGTMVNSTNIYSSSINTTHLLDSTITDSDISDITNLTLGKKITFTLGEIIDNIINGWIRVTGNLQVDGDVNITGSLNVSENITADYYSGDGSQLTGVSTYNLTYDVFAQDIYVNESGDTMTGDLLIGTHNFSATDINITNGIDNGLYFDYETGRVGIGTAAPTAIFQVVTTATNIGAYIDASSVTSGKGLRIEVDANMTSDGRALSITRDGGVRFTVDEWGAITGSSFSMSGAGQSTLAGNLVMSNKLIFNIGDSGTDFTTGGGLNLAGNLGIGTSSPSNKLDVQNAGTNETDTLRLGDSSANCTLNPEPSTLLIACSSDEKIKQNIEEAPSSLDKLKDIKIRKFDTDSGKDYIGVVAQEIQETNPDMVKVDEQSGLIMVYEPNPWELLGAIQELEERIVALESGRVVIPQETNKPISKNTELEEKEITKTEDKQEIIPEQNKTTEINQTEKEEIVNETIVEESVELNVTEEKVKKDKKSEENIIDITGNIIKGMFNSVSNFFITITGKASLETENTQLKNQMTELKELVCSDHPEAEVCKEELK